MALPARTSIQMGQSPYFGGELESGNLTLDLNLKSSTRVMLWNIIMAIHPHENLSKTPNLTLYRCLSTEVHHNYLNHPYRVDIQIWISPRVA
jgi:hypothetical protein